MASSYYKQHPERSPFADTGLVIALAVTVVTVIKLLMYGLTYVSLIWLAVTIIYVAIAAATAGNSKTRHFFTSFYMFFSLVAMVAAFTFDNPIQPKRESEVGTLQEDYFQQPEEQENPVIIETPKPVAVETDVVTEDASKFEEVAPQTIPEDYPEIANNGDNQDMEVVDMTENNYTPENPTVSAEETPSETKIPEQTQFDETFQ